MPAFLVEFHNVAIDRLDAPAPSFARQTAVRSFNCDCRANSSGSSSSRSSGSTKSAGVVRRPCRLQRAMRARAAAQGEADSIPDLVEIEGLSDPDLA